MLTPQFTLALATKLVVDLFAGGGGASTGIEQAIGRPVDIAINHDDAALACHRANHPQTRHLRTNVWDVNPLEACGGRPVGLLWASPDCRHFSPAKGSAPVSDRVRSLAWVVVKWAKAVGPDVILLENIPEFRNWGPVVAGRPCPDRKGKTFRRWLLDLQRAGPGYDVEFRELRACDFGVPTIRKRLFMVAKRRGTSAIVWPEPTHGPGLKPYRTAAECIDWTIPCPSIFLTAEEGKAIGVKRPLADATLRRIAHGVVRYVIQAKRPFLVPVTHAGGPARVHSIDEPARTVTGAHRGESALVAPTITRIGQTGGNGAYTAPVTNPLTTVTTKAEHLLVAPTLATIGYGEAEGQAPRAAPVTQPLGTVVGSRKHGVAAAFLAKHFGGPPAPGKTACEADAPTPTVTARDHTSVVAANLIDSAHGDTSPSGARRWSHGNRSAETPLPTVTTSGNPALVASALVKLRGTSSARPADEPLGTVSAQGQHHAAVAAFLTAYYGTLQDGDLAEPMHTVPTKDRFTVVTVAGVPHIIDDIGMRMLQPRELFRAQGFADSYIIDWGLTEDGKRVQMSKETQVRLCGNSVCPPLARMLVEANYSDVEQRRAA